MSGRATSKTTPGRRAKRTTTIGRSTEVTGGGPHKTIAHDSANTPSRGLGPARSCGVDGIATSRTPGEKRPVPGSAEPGQDTPLSLNGREASPSCHHLMAHRRRQASVATILDKTFGKLAQSDPRLWDRRAYLMLVGLVYERLALNEDELSSDELVALAKILAENRRADARTRSPSNTNDDDTDSAPKSGPLPQRFADAVRQVYGLEE